jgi:hypothetical protein
VRVNQDGTPYIGDPLSPHMLGQRHAQRGRPSPPLYDSRAEADDYATWVVRAFGPPGVEHAASAMAVDPVAADVAAHPFVTYRSLRRYRFPAGRARPWPTPRLRVFVAI